MQKKKKKFKVGTVCGHPMQYVSKIGPGKSPPYSFKIN